MWMCKLVLLAVVGWPAPLALAMPKPAVSGAPFGGQVNQYGPYDPYDSHLYNQRQQGAYDDYYNTASYDNGFDNSASYDNGYYNRASYADDYYDSSSHGYIYSDKDSYGKSGNYGAKQYGEGYAKQDSFNSGYSSTGKYNTEKYDAKKHDSGKYNAEKYHSGKYDAKKYNSGKHNARNYDSGHYDHEKYGTKPVNSAKLKRGPDSGDYKAKSVGAESRAFDSKARRSGFFIRSNGDGKYNWGMYTHKEGTDASHVPIYAPKKDNYGKDKSYDTKVLSHSGKNANYHAKETSYTSYHGKDSSHHDKETSYGNKNSYYNTDSGYQKQDSQSYGKDSRYHKESSYHGKDSSYHNKDSTYHQKDSSHHKKDVFSKIDVLGPNHKQIFTGGKRVISERRESGPSFTEQGDFRSDGKVDRTGKDFDSYGFYADLANLYAAKHEEKQPFSAALDAKVDNSGKDFDSYGFYSDVSNLYANTEQEKLSRDSAFDVRQSPNSLNFNTEKTTRLAFDSGISQRQPQRHSGFDRRQPLGVPSGSDSYGFYSDLSNLYGDKSWKPSDAASFDANRSSKDFDTGLSKNELDFDTQQSSLGDKPDKNFSPKDAEFDSYGFYSDKNNLYSGNKPGRFREESDKRRSSFDAGFDGRRFQNEEGLNRDRQFDAGRFNKGRALNDASFNKFESRDSSSGQSQNEAEFDSYGFYSNLRNLYQ